MGTAPDGFTAGFIADGPQGVLYFRDGMRAARYATDGCAYAAWVPDGADVADEMETDPADIAPNETQLEERLSAALKPVGPWPED